MSQIPRFNLLGLQQCATPRCLVRLEIVSSRQGVCRLLAVGVVAGWCWLSPGGQMCGVVAGFSWDIRVRVGVMRMGWTVCGLLEGVSLEVEVR